jgi:hypothetical protein
MPIVGGRTLIVTGSVFGEQVSSTTARAITVDPAVLHGHHAIMIAVCSVVNPPSVIGAECLLNRCPKGLHRRSSIHASHWVNINANRYIGSLLLMDIKVEPLARDYAGDDPQVVDVLNFNLRLLSMFVHAPKNT